MIIDYLWKLIDFLTLGKTPPQNSNINELQAEITTLKSKLAVMGGKEAKLASRSG